MNRRILLIDSDPTFRTNLTVAVQKYRIDVIHQPDADDAIAYGTAEPPALLVVGVEEPEKMGFKIFQRLKKGPLSKVPIMLVTSSVAPESFAKHKGLKTHADEYADKRMMSKGDLATKVDALIGLGDPAEEDLDIPVEVDDINVGDDNVIDEDESYDGSDAHEYVDQRTVMGGPDKRIDTAVADDVDDAFAGMMGGDSPSLEAAPPPVRKPTPIPEVVPPAEAEMQEFDDLPSTRADMNATMDARRMAQPSSTAPVAMLDESTHVETATADRAEYSVVEAIPGIIEDGGRRSDDDFDDFSKEQNGPYAMDDVIASKDDIRSRPLGDLAAQSEAPVAQVEEAVRAKPSIFESQPAIQLDADDLEMMDGDIVIDDDGDDDSGIPEPVPHPRSADDAAEAAVVQSKPRFESSPSIDLGLEKLAEDADKEQQSGGHPRASSSDERDQSGVYDRRALRKIGELERQIAQLKTELDRSRAIADAAAKGGGREQTFLNLREKMMAADNEARKARADLTAREREFVDLEARVGAAQEQRQMLEAKTVELEQRLAAEAAKSAAAAKNQEELQSTLSGVEGALGEKTEALAKAQRVRAQLEQDLANERAMRASNASDAERQLRIDREQLVARHQGELQELRQSLQSRHDAALAQLRSELEGQHAGAVAAVIEATRSELGAEAADAIAQLEAQREADMATLGGEHQAAIVQLRGELDRNATRTKADLEQQLAQVKSEYETLLAHTKSDYESKLARSQRELEAQLADAHGQIDSANTAHEQALAQQANAHATELTNQANQHAAALAARERALTTARQDDAIAHTAALAELKTELDKTIAQHGIKLEGAQRELDELIALHEQTKSDIVGEQEAAQARLAKEHADELARLAADKQRAADDLARTAAEHRAALDRAAEQHREDLTAQRDAADREIAELRQVLVGAKRQMEEAASRSVAEREQLEAANAQALAEQKAQHERAIAVANGEIVKVKAVADSEHNRAMAAAKAEIEKERKERDSAHGIEIRDLTSERDEVTRGLSAARDTIKRSENELASAVQTIADRNAELRSANAAIAERDQRIADLRKEIEAIEQENANYQEQVLRAYQRIKSDEAAVARAKKAMAIALTVLDDQGTPKSESEPT